MSKRETAAPQPSGKHLRSVKSCAAWCWADKAALRSIREAFDASNDVASALGTYFALCEIASNYASDNFQTTHAAIAHTSGLSVRTVQHRLKQLAELEIIEVETPSLRAPSTYRLIAFGNHCTTDTQPLPSARQRTIQGPLPTLEESTEESKKNGRRSVAGATPASDSEWLAELKADKAYEGIDVDREHAKMLRWCKEKRKRPTRGRFVNWLNRADRTLGGPELPRRQGQPI